jgi:hypothetical protein
MVWEYLYDRSRPEEYSFELVNKIVIECKSGDERHPIETIDDTKISDLSTNLEFVEETLAFHNFTPKRLFLNRFPDIYKMPREPLHRVNAEEIEHLVEKYSSLPV